MRARPVDPRDQTSEIDDPALRPDRVLRGLVGRPAGQPAVTAGRGWGDDPRVIGGYALTDAESIVRILLPARRQYDDAPTRWADVAAALHREPPQDGRVSWFALTEFPGTGGFEPSAIFLSPAGRFDEFTRSVLLEAIASVLPVHAPWTSPSPAAMAGTLAEISAGWTTTGFPGHARSDDGLVGIAAPRYSDSVVVSGPDRLGQRLLNSSLEAFPVGRSEPNRISVD